ncbi:hypothetical protein CHARACLAT_021171 [Characodon lateralis]|uniref:Uncharacterized protein n=1 Tax=Characodon lateralis TaxID=208331 RepID=A0ABU7CT22_9TELE|nr:hypothetical protein [Characodon lateralis]
MHPVNSEDRSCRTPSVSAVLLLLQNKNSSPKLIFNVHHHHTYPSSCWRRRKTLCFSCFSLSHLHLIKVRWEKLNIKTIGALFSSLLVPLILHGFINVAAPGVSLRHFVTITITHTHTLWPDIDALVHTRKSRP